jgi:hypothetical protein
LTKKSFIPKKILSVPWIALFLANRLRLDVLTFLIKGFERSDEFFITNLDTYFCDTPTELA